MCVCRNGVHGWHWLYIQRQKGQEKFDIALQKLDEEDAADELLMKLEEESLAHYNYSKVMAEFW